MNMTTRIGVLLLVVSPRTWSGIPRALLHATKWIRVCALGLTLVPLVLLVASGDSFWVVVTPTGLLVLAHLSKLALARYARSSSIEGGERCLECGYPLRGLPRSHQCPECGIAYDLDTVRHTWLRVFEELR